MDFKFIGEAISMLNSFAEKDKKYKQITDDITNLLSNLEVEFLSFTTAHNNVLNETFNSQNNIKKIHDAKIDILYDSFEHYKDEVKHKIDNLKRVKSESLVLIDEEIKTTINKLEQDLLDAKTAFDEILSANEINKSKDLSYIEKTILEIKKDSSKSIAQIELNYNQDLNKIESRFKHMEESYNQKIKEFEMGVLEEKSKIQIVKNEYREQSDSKYLSIKNEYHQQSMAFNKKVDSIKKKRNDKLNKLTNDFNNQIEPLQQLLSIIEAEYQANSEIIQKEYDEKLSLHKEKYENIVENFNHAKQKIIRESTEHITLLNSKLSAYKEYLAKERMESQKEHNEKLIGLSEQERTLLNKERNKKLRQQDNELNKQILRTNKENLQKSKEQYELLSLAEAKFIEEMTDWRIEEKVLGLNFKLQNYNNYLNYQNKLKENDVNQKKLKITFDHDVEQLDIEQIELISPLETSLASDNAMSERDVNLLSNDTNYHLNHYQFKEDNLDYKLQIFKLEQKLMLDKERLLLDHLRSVYAITQQLGIEKENVIRDQQIKNQELKTNLIIETNTLNEKLAELNYALKRSEIETQINYLQKEKQALHTFYDKDLNTDVEVLKFDLSFEEERLLLTENLEVVNRDVGLLSKDLNVIHSRIDHLFNQIFLIYNIQHHLMLKLVKLYQLPAHPEDVKVFINLNNEIFKDLRIVQEQAKDDFLLDIKNFHEIKINDITGQKYQSLVQELEEELNTKLQDLDEDQRQIENSIKKIDYQIQVLGNNVDKIQSNINKIEVLKSEESTRKGQRQHQNEIDSLVRQINSIEIEMNNLEKEIERHKKPIDKIEQQRLMLKDKFELDKKNLHAKQQLDAKVYFEQLSFYQNFMKKLTNLFNAYENKVLVLTTKLNQPLYLTDDLIKDAQKSFQRVEDNFERQANFFYQDLLKYSIQVFDKLNLEQNTLKDNYQKLLQKNMVLNKKKIANLKFLKNQQIIRHNQNLNTLKHEEQTYIKTLSLNINKEKQPKINDLRADIKLLESQIMATEEKLKNELLLIDDNLKSAIDQMKADHQKNLVRTHEQYLRNVQKATDAIDQKQKNLKQLEESTKVKNNLLFTRFNQTDAKLKEQLKEKLQQLKEQHQKNDQNCTRKIEHLTNELHALYLKHNTLIQEEAKKSKQIALQIDKIEKRKKQRELKDAKKSYQYKIRALKL
ncbi:hypothetical protein [Acholeplasma hippikon]|uniref:Uncharacterized protein n=1 Tax=Acholeplasma hippikon TaxID=264636 RepID=A0A449BJL8_9MOLU|nr:hypothetical protein [Acholeplasma hippikon]VEU82628.1 Uncharacterised protein [Acholeplasma hippikon]